MFFFHVRLTTNLKVNFKNYDNFSLFFRFDVLPIKANKCFNCIYFKKSRVFRRLRLRRRRRRRQKNSNGINKNLMIQNDKIYCEKKTLLTSMIYYIHILSICFFLPRNLNFFPLSIIIFKLQLRNRNSQQQKKVE